MKFPTYEEMVEMAQNVAEKMLDEYEYKGKTLRQWIEIISAFEHGTNLAEVGTDCISRQAAIDALKEHRALFCDNTPDTFSKLPYAEKSRVDELDMAIATLINLPSAQPDKDMIHLQKEQAYMQGWEEGRKALREEIWENERDRLD